jgi:hypothetical protein
MRYLHVPPESNQKHPLQVPIARLEGPSAGAAVVSLSVGNFVENLREMIDQMVSYVWGRFLTIDVKEARKPRKKAERSDR